MRRVSVRIPFFTVNIKLYSNILPINVRTPSRDVQFFLKMCGLLRNWMSALGSLFCKISYIDLQGTINFIAPKDAVFRCCTALVTVAMLRDTIRDRPSHCITNTVKFLCAGRISIWAWKYGSTHS